MAEIGVHKRPIVGLPDEHNGIPVWNSENRFLEDFKLGAGIRRTVSEYKASEVSKNYG